MQEKTVLSSDLQFQRMRQAEEKLEAIAEFLALPPPPENAKLTHFWRYPSFDFFSRWLVYHAPDRSVVRRVVWDRPGDLGRTTLEPTLYSSQAEVDHASISLFFEKLREISIPFAEPRTGIIIDGTQYGFASTFGPSSVRFLWIVPPPGWEAFVFWFQEFTEFLDQNLPLPTPEAIRRG
ncbi:hypothetical protein [Leptospira adleri]|nr:hypothetical protein [Leptospira adleri]